jgi:enoyl-CoA hydratase/carnithine racemase
MSHRLLLTYVPAAPPQAEAPAPPPAKVAVLTLHHAAKRNALDAALCQAIEQALHTAAAEGAQAAVLTGEGPVFCAGSDISSLPEEPDPAWLRGHGPLQSAMYAVSQGPLPVVAALNGPAIGAGCELALSCDLRVAHPEVTLQMPPVRLGLIYTPEGIQRLIALCGLGRTRELLLTARAIDAAEALSWGLLNRVVVAGAGLCLRAAAGAGVGGSASAGDGGYAPTDRAATHRKLAAKCRASRCHFAATRRSLAQ